MMVSMFTHYPTHGPRQYMLNVHPISSGRVDPGAGESIDKYMSPTKGESSTLCEVMHVEVNLELQADFYLFLHLGGAFPRTLFFHPP